MNTEEHLRSVLRRSMEINGDRLPDNPSEERPAVSAIDPQEFGALKAQVQMLLEANKVNTELLTTLTENMTAMRLQMAEARGGWKALMLIGGASASLGGIATWLMTHLFGGMPR